MSSFKVRALVVGFGSIGRRHLELLNEMGLPTAVVSRHGTESARCFATVEEALAEWQPGYVVVSNETARHHDTISVLAKKGFSGAVLVEKPLFDSPRPMPQPLFLRAAVAYNLRFHPVVASLIGRLQGQHATSADFHVGQWLPEWRPGTDYRESSSARRASGGGVLRDLSHEIDLALHLFGPWRRLTALGGHFSSLEIETDDTFGLLVETERCPLLTIRLNYLERPLQRRMVVHTDCETISADLVTGTLAINGQVIEQHTLDRNDTYRNQHRALLEGRLECLCSLEDGLVVVDAIAAAEAASSARIWVERS